VVKQASAWMMVLLGCALLAAGCGGTDDGRDIASVRACLEGLGLNVEAPPADDEDVEEGVFATTDLSAASGPGDGENEGEAAEAEFTFALAAIVTSEEARTRFREESSQFAETTDQDGRLSFESGSEGNYVWVAGGERDSDQFDEVLGCVKP
jgi:hypothetical protein